MTINLLLEAVDISSSESLYKAIERGQVPGVSLKKILADQETGFVRKNVKEKEKIDSIKNSLDILINKIKSLPENRKNLSSPIILLVLKKVNNKMMYFANISKYFDSIDPYLAYFLNKDKQEAKTTHKKLFDDFANGELDKEKDHKFEQEINKLFAKTKTIKDYDKEVEVIYPEDKDGWEVLSPKTFAASSKLACMNGRKSKWCTAARNDMFSNYSNNGNKLFIIKNEKLDKMFQMDFGERGEWGGYRPNFMDEDDDSMTLKYFKENNFPEELLKSIKNKRGEDLYTIIKNSELGEEEVKRINAETIEKNRKKIEESIDKNSFKIDDWKIYKMISKNMAEEKFKIKLFNIHFYGDIWESDRYDKYLDDRKYKKSEYVYQALNSKDSSKVQDFEDGIEKAKDKEYFYVFINKNNKFYYTGRTTYSNVAKGPQKFSLYQVNEEGAFKHIDLKEFLELNLSPEIKKIIKPELDERMESKMKSSFEKIKEEPDYKLIKKASNKDIKFYKINNLAAIKHLTPKIANLTFLNPKIITREKKGEEAKLRNIAFKMFNNFNNLYYFKMYDSEDYYTDGEKIINYYKGKIKIVDKQEMLLNGIIYDSSEETDVLKSWLKVFPRDKKLIIRQTLSNKKDYEIIQYPYDSKIGFLLVNNMNISVREKLEKMFKLDSRTIKSLNTENRGAINGLFIIVDNKLYNINEEKAPRFFTKTNKDKDMIVYIKRNDKVEGIKLKYGPWFNKIREKMETVTTSKGYNSKGVYKNYYKNSLNGLTVTKVLSKIR